MGALIGIIAGGALIAIAILVTIYVVFFRGSTAKVFGTNSQPGFSDIEEIERRELVIREKNEAI